MSNDGYRVLKSRRPAYLTVRHDLAHKIAIGVYPPGSDLPSVRALCEFYGCSHITVTHALTILSEERMVRCRRGSPARVVGTAAKPGIETLRRSGLRIALLSNTTTANGMFPYEDGPCGWLSVQCAMEALLADGNAPVPLSLRYDWQTPLAALDGAIVFNSDPELYAQLLTLGKPFVLMGYRTQCFPSNSVALDERPAVDQIGTYFMASGVRKVLVISTVYSSAAQAAGVPEMPFKLELIKNARPMFEMFMEHGLSESDFVALPCRHFRFLPEKLEATLAELARSGPVGVFANGDLLARGVVDCALKLGLKLKEDLVVVGVSGLPESSNLMPMLSTEQPPYRKQAEMALAMLYEQVRFRVVRQPNRQLAVKFVIRQS